MKMCGPLTRNVCQLTLLFVSTTAVISATASASVVYVNQAAQGDNDGSSWQHAFVDLQSALVFALPGDEIWVAEGIYRPTAQDGSRELSFQLVSEVAVYGGFVGDETDLLERNVESNVTILSGDLNDNDGPQFTNNTENSYRVVDGTGTNSSAILDGFVITAGNANGKYPFDRGGGLFVSNGSPSIRSCAIETNSSAALGSGGYCEFSESSFTNCKFIANSGAGLFTAESRLAVVGSEFRDNPYGGWSAYGPSGSIVIDTLFVDNGGGEGLVIAGGVYNEGSDAVFSNCVFVNNEAEEDGAGLYNTGANVLVSNCRFSGNRGIFGTNIWNDGDLIVANSSLTNSNFGISSGYETLQIRNSLVWSNGDGSETAQIRVIDGEPGTVLIDYASIQGWTGMYGGIENNGDDPKFVDPDGLDDIPGTEDDDLRLMPGSPAIDSGDNNALPADEFDLDGDGDLLEPLPTDLDGCTRFVDDPATADTGLPSDDYPFLSIVDRGAYEYRLPCEGDANGDDVVDPLDAGFVLARFGCSVGAGDVLCDAADVNGDGIVDPLDDGFVLARLGSSCCAPAVPSAR